MVCGIAPYGNNVVVLSYDEQASIQEARLHGVWHRSLWQQIVVLSYDEQDSIQEVRLHGVWHRSLWQQRRGTVI